MVCDINVKFEEINLKLKQFEKGKDVKKSSKRSRSTFSHNRYRKTLSILNIVTVFSARMLTGQRSPTHRAVICSFDYELYVIYNKAQKVRTSQLWFVIRHFRVGDAFRALVVR